jgi:hypothetical protein
MTYEQFAQMARDELPALWHHLKALYARQADYVQELEVALAVKQLKLEELDCVADTNTTRPGREDVVRARDLTIERDRYALQIAQQNPITISEEGAITSTLAGVATRKSVKISDPPTLSDGKKPRFSEWLVLMKLKLNANADHYPTPALRISYVASRTKGGA